MASIFAKSLGRSRGKAPGKSPGKIPGKSPRKVCAASLGEKTEQLALEHLRSAGLELVIRNFRCRVGEIDLVMLDGDCLVIVEVRGRRPGASRSSRYPTAMESVGPHKQRKLTRATLFFLAKHKGFRNHKVRFDVVACDGPAHHPAHEQYTLQWIKDAFRPGG